MRIRTEINNVRHEITKIPKEPKVCQIHKFKNVTDRKSAEAYSPIAANVDIWYMYLGSRMILHMVARFPTTQKNAIVKVAQANAFSKVVPIYISRNSKVISSKVELSPILSSILIFTSLSMFFVADVVILKYIFISNGQLNHIY